MSEAQGSHLTNAKRVHFVGIGGIGLSAIARVLCAQGYVVSGSDARATTLTAELAAQGMHIEHGHDAAHVAGADLVVVSSAVPEQNPELQAARRMGIPVIKRDQLLGEMMADRYGIAVAGTHGKTTTAALIAFVLAELGLDPTFIVGGILQNLGTNARLGHGCHFVVEADEYDHTFLGLRPQLAVMLSIEMDHPDCFKNLEAVSADFGRFAHLVPDGGHLIGCADDARVLHVLQQTAANRSLRIVTYGLQRGDWQARQVRRNEWGGSDWGVFHAGQPVGDARLQLVGLHNISNALAVLAVADCLGLDLGRVLGVLPRFRGVRRRFECKGEAQGIVVIDDYAHHPTQIKATLAAARRRFGARPVWVFFQPHTYSRTKALLDEYARSFSDADHVLVSEIYAAREKDDLGVHGHDLVQRMSHPDAHYVATLQEASDYLSAHMQSGDVLLTLGAGNGDWVGEDVLTRLRQRASADPVLTKHSTEQTGVPAGRDAGSKYGH